MNKERSRRMLAPAEPLITLCTKFLSVSVIATVVDLAIYSVLTGGVGVPALAANVLSFCLAAVLGFELNRRMTFAHRHVPMAIGVVVKYFVGVGISLALSEAVILATLAFVGPFVAKIISLVGTYIWNLIWSSFVTFRHLKADISQ